jgi:hypothetical protein
MGEQTLCEWPSLRGATFAIDAAEVFRPKQAAPSCYGALSASRDSASFSFGVGMTRLCQYKFIMLFGYKYIMPCNHESFMSCDY